jgi:hypothetical protein
VAAQPVRQDDTRHHHRKDDAGLRAVARDWPSDRYVDTFALSFPVPDDAQFIRSVERALAHVAMRAEVASLRKALDLNESRVRDVYSEIREVKSLNNESIIKQLEKAAIEAKYVWFQRSGRGRKDPPQDYEANGVSGKRYRHGSDIVQAGGATTISWTKQTLGRYLAARLDDTFLTHSEFLIRRRLTPRRRVVALRPESTSQLSRLSSLT